jgi:Fic family protein
MIALKWKPIEDLPEDWRSLASSELAALGAIWREQSVRLSKGNSFVRFNERLAREWAIETGILERIYTIDRGITQILIEKGLEASLIPHGCSDKPAEEVVSILRDHREALEGLFAFVSSQRDLSNSYIKELHQVMTRNQETSAAINGLGRRVEATLLRGDWKKLPNNPSRLSDGEEVHQYCPPEHVAAEMDRLIAMHQAHARDQVPPEVEAAWLHHRFTQIHPFQDGNGRIARALASLIFIRGGWFPLVVSREQREEYIQACETADHGDLQSLVGLLIRIQKPAFIRALSISEDLLAKRESYQDIIAAAGEKLSARNRPTPQDKAQVYSLAEKLEKAAETKFYDVISELNRLFENMGTSYRASFEQQNAETKHWFIRQTVKLARKNEYVVETNKYWSWLRIRIQEEREASLVVSFHSLGKEFLGIMAASAFMLYWDKEEDEHVNEDGPYQPNEEIFQFAYNEQPDEVLSRFRKWLDRSVVSGLDHWRKQL